MMIMRAGWMMRPLDMSPEAYKQQHYCNRKDSDKKTFEAYSHFIGFKVPVHDNPFTSGK
jgi:hypothetical protein